MSQEIRNKTYPTAPASTSREDRKQNVSSDSHERTIDRKGQSEQAGGARNWQDTSGRMLTSDRKDLPQRKATYDPRAATPLPIPLLENSTRTHTQYESSDLSELAGVENFLESTESRTHEQDILTLSTRTVTNPNQKPLSSTKWGRFRDKVISFFKNIFSFKSLRSRKAKAEKSSVEQINQEQKAKTLNKMISRRMRLYARKMKKYPGKIDVPRKFAKQFHGLSADEHKGYQVQLELLEAILKEHQNGQEWQDPIMNTTLYTLSAMDALFKIFDAKDISQLRMRLLEDEQRVSEGWRPFHDD